MQSLFSGSPIRNISSCKESFNITNWILEKLLKEKGKNPRKFSNCFNCWSHSRQLKNYELKTHCIEVNLILLKLFGWWTSKTPQTIHNLINWIWKAFFMFAHSTHSFEIFLMENYLLFKECRVHKNWWKISFENIWRWKSFFRGNSLSEELEFSCLFVSKQRQGRPISGWFIFW